MLRPVGVRLRLARGGVTAAAGREEDRGTEQGDRDAAVAEFRAALQHDPNSVDAHNNLFRVAWEARLNGEVVLRGLDVDDVGVDGRLTRVVGFFDQP